MCCAAQTSSEQFKQMQSRTYQYDRMRWCDHQPTPSLLNLCAKIPWKFRNRGSRIQRGRNRRLVLDVSCDWGWNVRFCWSPIIPTHRTAHWRDANQRSAILDANQAEGLGTFNHLTGSVWKQFRSVLVQGSIAPSARFTATFMSSRN